MQTHIVTPFLAESFWTSIAVLHDTRVETSQDANFHKISWLVVILCTSTWREYLDVLTISSTSACVISACHSDSHCSTPWSHNHVITILYTLLAETWIIILCCCNLTNIIHFATALGVSRQGYKYINRGTLGVSGAVVYPDISQGFHYRWPCRRAFDTVSRTANSRTFGEDVVAKNRRIQSAGSNLPRGGVESCVFIQSYTEWTLSISALHSSLPQGIGVLPVCSSKNCNIGKNTSFGALAVVGISCKRNDDNNSIFVHVPKTVRTRARCTV